MCDLYLNDKWVKATPAFDANLCRFMGIATMEFDGTEDSVFSEYNLDGAKHMEYISSNMGHLLMYLSDLSMKQ